MRVPRIYTEQSLTPHHLITLEPEPSHHLAHVLRIKIDDELRLFNGDGREYTGTVTQISNKQVNVDISEQLREEPHPSLSINLMIGVSRGERMDYALQKAVELGVTSIQPVFSRRCMVKLHGKRLDRRREHWQRIVASACEQAARCRLPDLQCPRDYTAVLQTPPLDLALLLDHRSRKSLHELPSPAGRVSLLIGPEGGLTDDERSLAHQQGFLGIRLGPRILRTETAPLAAIAAIQTLWGDF